MPFEVALHSDDAGLNLPGLSDVLWMGVEPGYVQDLADCVTPAAQWRGDHLAMADQSLFVTDGDFSGVVMPCRVGGPVKVAQAVPVSDAEPVAVPEPDPVAFVGPMPEPLPQAQDEPEDAPPEPCPAAVALIAAQLVTQAQESAKKAPRKARKVAKPEPVTA